MCVDRCSDSDRRGVAIGGQSGFQTLYAVAGYPEYTSGGVFLLRSSADRRQMGKVAAENLRGVVGADFFAAGRVVLEQEYAFQPLQRLVADHL